MAEDKDKLENPKPIPTNHEQTLQKLAKLEEKLDVLRDFNTRSEQLRETRKKLLANLINLNKEMKSTESKLALEEKRVAFADEDDARKKLSKKILPRTTSRASIYTAQKSKSLHDLLSNLRSWHGEVNRKKSEINTLKTWKQSLLEPEKEVEYDEKITKLEREKDELDEKILQFVLLNVSEGKNEYKDLIAQLEDENREMEDRVTMLRRQVAYFRETNIALMRENEYLQQAIENPSSPMPLDALQVKYRQSMTAGISSTMRPESLIFGLSSDLTKTASMKDLLDTVRPTTLSFSKM